MVGLGFGAIMLGALIKPTHAQESERRVVNVRIKGRRVIAPKGPIRVAQYDVVELRWVSNERTQLHLHGYDIKLEVRPGETAKMIVRAGIAGRFPITSHGWGEHGHGHNALTYLEVYPR